MLPRAQAVSTLAAEPFDVLVVGGGLTGAGVALDAATRGYSVALVERGDYAIGTSSRSSKLVHGGLRYLLVPALAGRSPSGGYLFYDCQTDDVRLVLTVLAEAMRFGAMAANRLEAVALLQDDGRPCGARVRDHESGEELEIRADNVVNATGVWADRLRPGELHDEAEVPVIRPSRGTHIIVPGATLPLVAGVIAPAGGGRTIFVLPWLGQTLVGTTDNDYEGDLERVRPAPEDVEYLLEAVNAFFATALEPSDIAGAYAGVRPLISTGDPRKSVDISRKAELYETSSGMVTITGGKLTTWRRMAKMTVDRIVERVVVGASG